MAVKLGKDRSMKVKPKSVSPERAVAFVVARLNSSRLPRKHFRRIGDKPLLDWVIRNLRQCRELDQIVIATVGEPANEALLAYAQKEGLACYWYQGDPNHVTTRLRRAAEDFGADICVLVSGDCPLISAPALEQMVRQFRRDPQGDYVGVPADSRGREPVLEGVDVARLRAWQLADDLSVTPELKEHQFPVIRLYPERFRKVNVQVPENLYRPRHRLSVDTYADLEFMNQAHSLLSAQGRAFSLPEVLQLLQEEPELGRINVHVHQRRLQEIIHPVLSVVDAGPEFGYGHLIRSRELALQLVEHLGWPVTFLVDDHKAAQLLGERGLPVAWGAWQRPARTHPEGIEEQLVPDLLANHDLMLLDIAPRPIVQGWRDKLDPAKRVIILDKSEAWTKEADLIILPGVTGPVAEEIFTAGPPVLSGLQYVIVRRDIRRLAGRSLNKDLDLLVYLHHPRQREAARNFIKNNKLQGQVIEGFAPDFPHLLARSRVLVSSFGYSFYEALALGTYPAAWPYSPVHDQEARQFYEALGLPPVIIGKEEDLRQILPFLSTAADTAPLEDGTPALVQGIFDLLTQAPVNFRMEAEPAPLISGYRQAGLR